MLVARLNWEGNASLLLELRYLTEKPRLGLRPDGHILELLRYESEDIEGFVDILRRTSRSKHTEMGGTVSC